MKSIFHSLNIILALGIFLPLGAQIMEVEGDVILKDNTPEIEFYDNNNARVTGSIINNADDLWMRSIRGDLKFYASETGLSAFRMAILGSNGNVGIGTSTPTMKLDVVGLSRFRDDLTIDVADLVLKSSNNQTFRLRTETSGDLSFVGDGGITVMEITDDTGRLGIGTTAPSTKIHVVGGSDVGSTGGGFIQLGSSTSTNVGLDDNEIMARDNGVAADLFLQNDGGNLMLCAQENGSVGIGIINGINIPSGYLLAIDGKVISEEVRVELSGFWPDYVFHKDYELLSIGELEKSILKNGHLPGIPSANEINENGLHLGDMQKRMMEKIEELTLYIIQQQKQINELTELLSKN